MMTLDKTAARPDLTPAERELVARGLHVNRRALALARARAALPEGRRDARRRSLEVAFGSGYRAPTRVKALAAAATPRLARRRLALQPRETTAGIFLSPVEEELFS